jgi:type III secretory pathway component EscS
LIELHRVAQRRHRDVQRNFSILCGISVVLRVINLSNIKNTELHKEGTQLHRETFQYSVVLCGISVVLRVINLSNIKNTELHKEGTQLHRETFQYSVVLCGISVVLRVINLSNIIKALNKHWRLIHEVKKLSCKFTFENSNNFKLMNMGFGIYLI